MSTPKGFKHSAESRARIADGLRASTKRIGRPPGIPLTAEHVERIRLRTLGRKHTEEARAKMRLHTGESKITLGFLGHKHTEETRARIGETSMGRKWSDEQKRAHSQLLTGKSTSISVGQKRVSERLKQEGCRVFQRGWPDLLVVDPEGNVRAIEIKNPRGQLSTEQVEVIAILRSIGMNVEVIYETNEQEADLESNTLAGV